MSWVVVRLGMVFVGPFETEEEARLYAKKHTCSAYPLTPVTPADRRDIILSWMKAQLINYPNDYLDCNEVNCTKLGEDASEHFSPDDENVDEIYFELAFTASEWFEEEP